MTRKLNRQQRRYLEKEYRKQRKKPPAVSRARADGRPQFYDIPVGEKFPCAICNKVGIYVRHKHGEVFINDPANSPIRDPRSGQPDEAIYTVCRWHIPDNAVIYNPSDNTCRTKDGSNTWTERS